MLFINWFYIIYVIAKLNVNAKFNKSINNSLGCHSPILEIIFTNMYVPKMYWLGGETDSAIWRRKRTGLMSARGREEAGCLELSQTFVKNAFDFLWIRVLQ